MNKNFSICLLIVIVTTIFCFSFNAIVEASNKYRNNFNKSKQESTVGTFKRSIYYEKEAVELLKDIKNQLILEEKESVKLLKEIRDILKKNIQNS